MSLSNIFYEICCLINYPWVSLVHQLLVTLLYCQEEVSWFTPKVGTHLYWHFYDLVLVSRPHSVMLGFPFVTPASFITCELIYLILWRDTLTFFTDPVTAMANII